MPYLDVNGLRRVKEKIDSQKMDKPANTGSTDQILRKHEDGRSYWADAASETEISQATAAWLQDNISVASETIALDASLTTQGAAADAKATGAMVKVSQTEPTEPTNRIWVNSSETDEIEMPTYDEFSEVSNDVADLKTGIAATVNNAYVEKGVAYFTHDDTVLFELTGIGGGEGGGGGGGGGSSTSTITVNNTTGWTTTTVAKDADVNISLYWSSVDNGVATGAGSMTVVVGGVSRSVIDVEQGNVSVNVKPYLAAGNNRVQIIIADVDGNSRTKVFSVNVIDIYIESTFDPSVIQTGSITIPYTVWGEIEKTIHITVDGVEQPVVNTSSSGREANYVVSAQSHRSHAIEMWFVSELNQQTIESNLLHYEVICVQPGNNTPIISINYGNTAVTQYSTVNIPFMVYTPSSQVSDVLIEVNGTEVQSLSNVDRSMQSFSYRLDNTGSIPVTITSGATSKSIVFTVTGSQINIHAETANLSLYLSSIGRSNSEQNPGTWTYGSGQNAVECVFNGFNFVSDGWQKDEDGISILRVKGDARLTIPYQIFKTDFRSTGKTIEIEFGTRDVRNYSDVLISCMNGGRGISVTAQECQLAGEQSGISAQFKEDEHVRVSFVVEKSANGLRLIRCYINGILSRVTKYPSDDNFEQVSPVGISVGNDEATIDIYCIRVYDNDLTSRQIVNNWIADTQNGAEMLARYSHNDVLDSYGNVVINKLPSDLPYFVIECEELPQFKGDKKNCSGRFVNPLSPNKNFTFSKAQIDVQGTSSQYYWRKNYKIKFKNGIINANGATESKYQMNSSAIPVNTFCFKADVASSEGANNVELARLYNEICPYKTPAQEENSKVRQGIDGFPMVIFWSNPSSGTTSFLGKYNFNNDKSTEDVFGFVEGDESWETKNHDGARVIYKSDDFSNGIWKDDYEARYPDTDPPYEDIEQLSEFVHWVYTTDPTTATGNALSSSVTWDGTTYTHDTAAYRKAKFKAELSNYCEVESALFFYLFTELFLLVDNRAKNQFISFIGEEVVQG